MRKSKFSETQIVATLKDGGSGVPVADLVYRSSVQQVVGRLSHVAAHSTNRDSDDGRVAGFTRSASRRNSCISWLMPVPMSAGPGSGTDSFSCTRSNKLVTRNRCCAVRSS